MCSSETDNHSTPTSLKVLQVVPRLEVGGVERGTVEFAAFLQQQGHRPTVISAGGALVSQLQQAGVTHIRLDVASKSPKVLWQARKLRSIMAHIQPHVVHARSRIPAWICHLAMRKSAVRPLFITTLHGLHSVNRYSAIMASSDQVIAVSNTAKTYLTDHYQAHLKRDPVVIYRGVDETFDPQHRIPDDWLANWQAAHPELNGQQTVLLPGRLSRVKGVENLFPWLQNMPDRTRLLLTASPEESAYARHIARLLTDMEVADKVCWLGIERDMPSLYQTVDLVLSVNRKAESFGRTVLEALTMGVPVVAYALGGVAEVMGELFPQGLVEAGQSDQLAERINAFLRDKPDVNVRHAYTNQQMFSQTLALYQRLLGQQHD